MGLFIMISSEDLYKKLKDILGLSQELYRCEIVLEVDKPVDVTTYSSKQPNVVKINIKGGENAINNLEVKEMINKINSYMADK